MATHSSIFAWRIPWTRSLAGYSPQGHTQSWRRLKRFSKQIQDDSVCYLALLRGNEDGKPKILDQSLVCFRCSFNTGASYIHRLGTTSLVSKWPHTVAWIIKISFKSITSWLGKHSPGIRLGSNCSSSACELCGPELANEVFCASVPHLWIMEGRGST